MFSSYSYTYQAFKEVEVSEIILTNYVFNIPFKQTTEDAAAAVPATDAAKTENGTAEPEQVTTNGTSETAAETVKKDEPAKLVVEVIKPAEEVKKAAEATVEEAIVIAAKQVDDKINVVSKPEVNQLQNVDTSEPNEKSLEQNTDTVVATNSDQSNTIINNNNQLNDTSVGSGDCTNNNNTINNSLPPPPLPDCPPPSQLSVFAESAMSPENNQNASTAETATLLSAPEQPQSIPIISTDVQSEVPLIGSTKIEVMSTAETVITEILENAQNTVEEKLKSETDPTEASETVAAAIVESIVAESQKLSDIVETIEIVEPESLPKPEEIAETIAMLDSVNESEVKVTDEAPKPLASDGDELADVSVDISSPLPQNSLESLPSPELSNVSPPPSEADENIASESIAADDKLPPPPSAAVDDDLIKESLIAVVANLSIEPSNAIEIANGNDSLPPPPIDDVVNATTDDNKIATNGDVKTNGDNNNEHTNGESLAAAPTTNGGCHDNGSEAVILSDKVIKSSRQTKKIKTSEF